jgi:XTP/dITP diphosphohydrolase
VPPTNHVTSSPGRDYRDGCTLMHDVSVRVSAWPRILIATTNAGKLREIFDALTGVPVSLLALSDLPAPPSEPDETGATFAENALIKARAYAYATGLPTVAEDSGLAIDALGGRPGIHSARYPGQTYDDKFRNLYAELAPHPRPWTARFVCALAFVAPPEAGVTGDGTVLYTSEGTVEGEIVPEPRGELGFGYDPIFFHPPFSKTLGEIDTATKRLVSHRGAAFRALRSWLSDAIDAG